MVKHTCNTCEKDFDRKSTYDYHIRKKNPCKPPKVISDKKYECGYCPSVYTRKYNLDKHLLCHTTEGINNKVNIKNDNVIKKSNNTNEIEKEVTRQMENIKIKNEMSMKIEQEITRQMDSLLHIEDQKLYMKNIIDTYTNNQDNREFNRGLCDLFKMKCAKRVELLNWVIEYVDTKY